jgi:hypothetical protein
MSGQEASSLSSSSYTEIKDLTIDIIECIIELRNQSEEFKKNLIILISDIDELLTKQTELLSTVKNSKRQQSGGYDEYIYALPEPPMKKQKLSSYSDQKIENNQFGSFVTTNVIAKGACGVNQIFGDVVFFTKPYKSDQEQNFEQETYEKK